MDSKSEAPGGDENKSADEQEASAEPSSTEPVAQEAPPKRRGGFASMDRALVRAIARKGGVAAHVKGTAHRFTHEEARVAGKKGGCAPHRVRGRAASVRPPSS
jgi:uncharacterized protein